MIYVWSFFENIRFNFMLESKLWCESHMRRGFPIGHAIVGFVTYGTYRISKHFYPVLKKRYRFL